MFNDSVARYGKYGLQLFFLPIFISAPGMASAQSEIAYSDLATGYSGCYYTKNGNGTITVEVTISWKETTGHIPYPGWFYSRGILVHTYDAMGRLNNSSLPVPRDQLRLDGIAATNHVGGNGYVMYMYQAPADSAWHSTGAVTAKLTATLRESFVQQWPAIGIRAANTVVRSLGPTTGYVGVAYTKGLAYIAASGKNGRCQVVTEPELPPPPEDVHIDMSAPDWDLGELKPGEETIKTLPEPNNQLCFSYDGGNYITYQKYLLTATNENGNSAGGAYLLKHTRVPTQTIPYQLLLNDGSTSISLPNPESTAFKLKSSGKTCFTPTFSASAPENAKGGAYSDVLTFTVVAKP